MTNKSVIHILYNICIYIASTENKFNSLINRYQDILNLINTIWKSNLQDILD